MTNQSKQSKKTTPSKELVATQRQVDTSIRAGINAAFTNASSAKLLEMVIGRAIRDANVDCYLELFDLCPVGIDEHGQDTPIDGEAMLAECKAFVMQQILGGLISQAVFHLRGGADFLTKAADQVLAAEANHAETRTNESHNAWSSRSIWATRMQVQQDIRQTLTKLFQDIYQTITGAIYAAPVPRAKRAAASDYAKQQAVVLKKLRAQRASAS